MIGWKTLDAEASDGSPVNTSVLKGWHQESTLKTEYEVKPNKQVKDTESDSVTDLKLKGDACESKYHTTHRMAQESGFDHTNAHMMKNKPRLKKLPGP